MRDGPASFWMFFLVLGGVAAVLTALVQASRKRDYEHRERMKSLEMGLTTPADNAWHAAICIAIGAGVPIAALVIGLVASLNAPAKIHTGSEIVVWTPDQSNLYYGCVWGASIAIGVVGVIAGTLLGALLLARKQTAKAEPSARDDSQKPLFDPDAYDTVGSRG